MYNLHEYNALTKYHKFEEDDNGGGTTHSHQAENDIQDMHLQRKPSKNTFLAKNVATFGNIWITRDTSTNSTHKRL